MNTPKNANRFMFFLTIHLSLAPFLVFIIGILFNITDIKKFITVVFLLTPIYCFILPILFYMLVFKKSFTDIIPIKKLSIKNTIFIILMGFLIQPIISFFSALTCLFFDNDVASEIAYLSDIPFILLLLGSSIGPAVCEELMFRGVILTGYSKAGIKKAAVVSGLFFAIMHLNPQQFLYAFLIGIFFAYIIYFTESIFSTMLLHFIINTSSTLAIWLQMRALGNEKLVALIQALINLNDKLITILSSFVMSLVFLPLFIFVFYKFIKNNAKKINTDIIIKMEESKNPQLKEKYKIFDKFLIGIFIIYIIYISVFYIMPMLLQK